MPKYQGEFDGLCGMYAIVNAIEECGEICTEDTFKLTCKALGKQRWPKVMWEGISFKDMQIMIRSCLKKHHTLKVNYPFMRNTPSSNNKYWERFDSIFENDNAKCAILGLTKPSAHWIVASKEGGRILFSDSTAGKPYERKNRVSLHAGIRRKKSVQWLVDRKKRTNCFLKHRWLTHPSTGQSKSYAFRLPVTSYLGCEQKE